MAIYHVPVLANQAIHYLNIQPEHWYIDCNLGGGGHTDLILGQGGKVIGIDYDQDSIRYVAQKYSLSVRENNGLLWALSKNLYIIQSNFKQIKKILSDAKNQLHCEGIELNGIRGVLFDLGPSSHQIDTKERGFSFMGDAFLDMRMDISTQTVTAKDLINGLHERELSELFWKLGEERFSRQIAKRIVEDRKQSPILTTTQLVSIINSVKRRESQIHPATKVFQALRIAVNDEINNLKEALPDAFEILDLEGRLVVISFHSLEDKIVKDYFREKADDGKGIILTRKPLEAESTEVIVNPRSRSAKLRAIEKRTG